MNGERLFVREIETQRDIETEQRETESERDIEAELDRY